MNKKWLFFALKLAVSGLLIFFMVKVIGSQPEGYQLFSRVAWFGVAGYLVFASVHYFLNGLNIYFLIRALHPVPLFTYLKFFSYAYAISLIAPGQFGDVSVTFFLKKQGVDLSKSLSAYMLSKILSVVVLSFVLILGFYVLIPQYFLMMIGISLGLCSGLILASLFFIHGHKLKSLNLERFKIFRHLQTIVKEYKSKYKTVLFVLALNFVNWLAISFAVYFGFVAFHQNIPFPEFAVIPFVANFASYLPITLGGIGTVEYAASYLFGLIGITQGVVFSAYIVMRASQFLLAAIYYSVFAALKVPNEK